MAGLLVQHLAECKAHAVVVVPNIKAFWYPRLQRAVVRSREVAAVNGLSYALRDASPVTASVLYSFANKPTIS